MLTFSKEPIATIWDEMIECAKAHWDETSMCKDGEVLDARLERYAYYEQIGMYHEFVARDNGKFAGFCGMYITPSMHTQEMLATEDILYLKPEYRKGRNALRFYQFITEIVGKLGAKKIMITAPPNNVTNKLLNHLGYEHTANMYSKRLIY